MNNHPRLFFTADELARLRSLRDVGVHAQMWQRIRRDADWCLTRRPPTQWIAPVEPDPIYENLYDRFFATMHDMAVAEYLAFAYAYSGDERYFAAAREWALALCRVWVREADGEPDANKAYAVTRLLKGVAVSYDLLYDRLSEEERRELKTMLLDIGGRYYDWYVKNPGMAAADQEPHHGSVEAASFGLVALALLGDAPQAGDWLDLMVRKHTDWLLTSALTKSLTHNQTSNFWTSITQYRGSFMDALRRVTGRDLFKEFAPYMDARTALACAAGPGLRGDALYAQTNESWLFGPSYGQLDYAAPALLLLAREYRRPIYQHLALWDATLGSLQQTRYVSRAGNVMLFDWGAYAYAWYDPAVPDAIEPGLPLSFLFEDPHENAILYMNEAYARASYEPGGLCVGVRRGAVLIHAGGRPVFIDFTPIWPPQNPVKELSIADDGDRATIRCVGADDSGFTEQTVTLDRPGSLLVQRRTTEPVRWWCHGEPRRDGNRLSWPNGATLQVRRGSIESLDPAGYEEDKVVGMGKLKLVDPMPTIYPVVVARPQDGLLEIEVTV